MSSTSKTNADITNHVKCIESSPYPIINKDEINLHFNACITLQQYYECVDILITKIAAIINGGDIKELLFISADSASFVTANLVSRQFGCNASVFTLEENGYDLPALKMSTNEIWCAHKMIILISNFDKQLNSDRRPLNVCADYLNSINTFSNKDYTLHTCALFKHKHYDGRMIDCYGMIIDSFITKLPF